MTVDELNRVVSQVWPRQWPKTAIEKHGFTGFKAAPDGEGRYCGQLLYTGGSYKNVDFQLPDSGSDLEIFQKACAAIREVEK